MTLRRNKKMPVLAVTGFIALVGVFSVLMNVNAAHAEYGVGAYTLTPSVDANSVSSSASAGQQLNIKSTITNSGQTKTKNNSEWQLTRMVVTSGSYPTGGASNTEPCGPTTGYFKSGARITCSNVNTGVGTMPVAHQQWFLDGNASTGYKIRLGGFWSTRCLDAGGTNDGALVTAYECNGTSHQQWDMRADGTIRDRRSGKCLDVDFANANNNGATVQIYKCEVAAKVNHRWVLNSTTNTLKLVSGSYGTMCLDGARDQAEAGWTKIKVQFWKCTSGEAFKSGVTTVPTQTSFIGEYPIGTQICFALSVRDRSNDSSQWQHSVPRCATVGKMPKVQVWGNDIMTGNRFAAFTLPGSQRSVMTSVTEQAVDSKTETAPATAFTGLWKTGVNSSGGKLSANASDPHWIIDRVYSPIGARTCQKIDIGSSSANMQPIPSTSSATPLAARVIQENASRTMAGHYVNDGTRVGEPFGDGSYLWNKTSTSSAWIGQNLYGRNYSESTCKDPTRDAQVMSNANIYVFKLKDGFTIDPTANVDLDSVRIQIKGGVDNRVKFFVNGIDLGAWQQPGWEPTSQATSGDAPRGTYQNGKNDLEIHVQSTFPMTGLLITEINALATRTTYDTEVYGSWGEYAIRPTGPVAGMASGAGLNGGRDTNTPSVWSNLTLAKSATGGCVATGYGCYVNPAQAKTIPDIESRYFTPGTAPNLTGAAGGSITMATQPAGRSVYLRNGDLTISGGTLTAGKTVIVKATGNVTITNNVSYGTGSITSLSQIPQLIIIANNIYIKDNVSQVDAWLIAKGTATSGGVLDTCDVNRSNYSQGMTITNCNNPLTINGPVMAQHLWLRRTGGSGAGTDGGTPAETINLRPDAYLWGVAQNSSTSQLQTTSTRELPPRF